MVLFFVDMILKALDGLAVADSLSQRDFVGVFEARANGDAVCHLADFDTTWLEQASNIQSCSFPLHSCVVSQNDFLYFCLLQETIK